MKRFRTVSVLSLLLAVCFVLSLSVGCNSPEDAKEYSLTVNSVTLTPGTLAKEPIAALGTPVSFSESGSCGGIPGTDKVYRYAGFTVYTVPGTEGDIIESVELTDDSVKTSDGLAVGSTKEAVTAALGAGEPSGDALVYTGTTTRLTFRLRDGKVTGIRFGQKTA